MPALNNNVRNIRDDGFSIIELMLVIIIISIISVASYPRFTNTVNSVNLRVATDKLKDDLRYIYNYSVTNHLNTWFAVSISGNNYRYGTYNTPPNTDPVVLTDPATNNPAIINLDDYKGVTITSENIVGDTIFYDWWGTPSPSTGGQITLNGIRTVVITAETGYVFEL
jgi:prepilin-type N-terminal cleavage/methylation domain-containing protein